jgi:hypothetical protein
MCESFAHDQIAMYIGVCVRVTCVFHVFCSGQLACDDDLILINRFDYMYIYV